MMGSRCGSPSWMLFSSSLSGVILKTVLFVPCVSFFVDFIYASVAFLIVIPALILRFGALYEGVYPTLLLEAFAPVVFIFAYFWFVFASNSVEANLLVFYFSFCRLCFCRGFVVDSGASRYLSGSVFHASVGVVSSMSALRCGFSVFGFYFFDL
ncbi:hypothetical protein SAMN05660776_2586 [Salegentibacter holothuriorum]|uniref:Uncharacterized protein n=2 Tax=Salegentibacter holothuriorum TaxID=241145 RepID=A0A1T5DF82_9FLAO|nr:hypothetical protein SAMN05660776_2586 [Salegentibacter holothuriorum]